MHRGYAAKRNKTGGSHQRHCRADAINTRSHRRHRGAAGSYVRMDHSAHRRGAPLPGGARRTTDRPRRASVQRRPGTRRHTARRYRPRAGGDHDTRRDHPPRRATGRRRNRRARSGSNGHRRGLHRFPLGPRPRGGTNRVRSRRNSCGGRGGPDRVTAGIFGDGVGAAVLQAVAGPTRFGPIILGADGGAGDAIITPRPAGPVQMDGQATFRRAVSTLAETSREALALAATSLDEVDLAVFHQANTRITQKVAQELGLPQTASSTASRNTETRPPPHSQSPSHTPKTADNYTRATKYCSPPSVRGSPGAPPSWSGAHKAAARSASPNGRLACDQTDGTGCPIPEDFAGTRRTKADRHDAGCSRVAGPIPESNDARSASQIR